MGSPTNRTGGYGHSMANHSRRSTVIHTHRYICRNTDRSVRCSGAAVGGHGSGNVDCGVRGAAVDAVFGSFHNHGLGHDIVPAYHAGGRVGCSTGRACRGASHPSVRGDRRHDAGPEQLPKS
jgi:hypothetical protein